LTPDQEYVVQFWNDVRPSATDWTSVWSEKSVFLRQLSSWLPSQ